MKYCINCGKEILENARFCSECGTAVAEQPAPVAAEETPVAEVPVAESAAAEPAPVYSVPAEANTLSSKAEVVLDDSTIPAEQECLDTAYRLLKWERKAWRIYSIAMLVITCFYGFIGLLATVLDGDAELFVASLFMLPIPIVSFKVLPKVDWYLNGLYTDAKPAYERGSAIGMIVFNVIFNSVAAVFFIINFIHFKTNKTTFERIIARQKQYNTANI